MYNGNQRARRLALAISMVFAFSRVPEVCGAPVMSLERGRSHGTVVPERPGAAPAAMTVLPTLDFLSLGDASLLKSPYPSMNILTLEQLHDVGENEAKAASLGKKEMFEAAARSVQKKARHYLDVIERHEDASAMGVPPGDMSQDEADEAFTAMEQSRVFFDGYRKVAPGSEDARRGLDFVEDVLVRAHALGGQKRQEQLPRENQSWWNVKKELDRYSERENFPATFRDAVSAMQWAHERSTDKEQAIWSRFVDVRRELFLTGPSNLGYRNVTKADRQSEADVLDGLVAMGLNVPYRSHDDEQLRLKIIQSFVAWSLSPSPHAQRIREAIVTLAQQSSIARQYAVQMLAKALIRSEHPKNPDLDPEIGLWIRSFIPQLIETLSPKNNDRPKPANKVKPSGVSNKPELVHAASLRLEQQALSSDGAVVRTGLARILGRLGFSNKAAQP